MEWTERGTKLVAFAIALVSIAALAVVLRFVSRGYLHRVLGLTDYVIALTLLFSIGNSICIAFHVSNGLGRSMNELTPPQRTGYFQAMFAAVLVGNISNVLTKFSILFLFLDVFVLPNMRRITRVLIAVVAAYGTYIIFSLIFFCVPIHAFWYLQYTPKRCLNGRIKWYVDAGLNITLDILMFCLPFPFLKFMSLPWKQKLWLHLVFALGFLVCIVSVVRLYYLNLSVNTQNKSKAGIAVTYLTTIEMNVAIIVACILTYKPLINRFCPRLLASIPSDSPEGCQGSYGTLEGASHPPTISSGPSRQQQDTESELQVL